jgi:hypothetical protein
MDALPSIPPSALPGISPTRGEIGVPMGAGFRLALASSQDGLPQGAGYSLKQGTARDLISPRVGEMPGRAEGGKTSRKHTGGFPSC